MSHTGHYVPYMIVGMVIACVGAGLVTRLTIDTPTAVWAAYLVVAGLGLGTAMQLPYTALQVVLSEADVPTGNGQSSYHFRIPILTFHQLCLSFSTNLAGKLSSHDFHVLCKP